MFGMLGVFAELEREMIKERVQVGMNRIKATIARDKKVHHQGRHRP
jgi:DNA invertase Pin-like site-specific DNA recombinase